MVTLMNNHQSVQDRYARAAKSRQETLLCCPVEYDPKYLKIIPAEVLERDYGCGDPSAYIRAGETVLDLGSGAGKICFIAAQIVGASGKVIGVDMTPDMLALARLSAPEVAGALGYANVEFRRGHIEDLKIDLDSVDAYLADNPVDGAGADEDLQKHISHLQATSPLIEDNSIDVIVSNCVLNLVGDTDKKQLFREIYRVLKPGGRIAISDIVSDEPSPDHLKADDKLWSGCISGALQEAEFLSELTEAGFYGVTLDKYDPKPWQIVEGIEYRSVTVLGFKQAQGVGLDKNQALIYKGPFAQIEDEAGQVFIRGQRTAVSDRTYARLQREPYQGSFVPVPPVLEVSTDKPFECCRPVLRSALETKRGVAKTTTDPSQGSCC